MITNPLRKKFQSITPIMAGLEGSVVELYQRDGLVIVARESLLSARTFRLYGDLKAACEFNHTYTGTLNKLAPFIHAENDLNPKNLRVIDDGKTHRVYQFQWYDARTFDNWRRHINGALVRDFEVQFKTVFQENPLKYGLQTRTG